MCMNFIYPYKPGAMINWRFSGRTGLASDHQDLSWMSEGYDGATKGGTFDDGITEQHNMAAHKTEERCKVTTFSMQHMI